MLVVTETSGVGKAGTTSNPIGCGVGFGGYHQAGVNAGGYIQALGASQSLALQPLIGNVGIGTTSPQALLHVKLGATAAAAAIFQSDSTINTTIHIKNPGAIYGWAIGPGSSVGDGSFPPNTFCIHQTGVQTRLAIKGENGYIGTGGINAPLYTLHLNGSGYSRNGSWLSGGADFAEYMESEDGREIPVGVPVVCIGLKDIFTPVCRPAEPGEVPDGVVSASPTVCGNAWDCWPKKYVRNSDGTKVTETVTVSGETKERQRARKKKG